MDDILDILFESMWVTRWKDNQVWQPNLSVSEAHEVCKEVINNLEKAGYEIKPINKKLDLWIIYFNPSDFPDKYVVRKWILDKPTDIMFTADTLDEIRKFVPEGLVNIGRQQYDDPVIVETWV